eukprot:Sspe_Gene.75983::Locus_47473_Transcript_1_1_Confidence_1.000_Length_3481::g.75983::m.75983
MSGEVKVGDRVQVEHEVQDEEGMWHKEVGVGVVRAMGDEGVTIDWEDGGEPYVSPPEYVRPIAENGTHQDQHHHVAVQRPLYDYKVGDKVEVTHEWENEDGVWQQDVGVATVLEVVPGEGVLVDWGDGHEPYCSPLDYVRPAVLPSDVSCTLLEPPASSFTHDDKAQTQSTANRLDGSAFGELVQSVNVESTRDDWFPCQTGNWVLNLDESDNPEGLLKELGVPGVVRKHLIGAEVTQVIHHTTTSFKLEERSKAGVERDDLMLDGKEHMVNDIPTKATVLPDGSIEVTKVFNDGQGPLSTEVRRMLNRTRLESTVTLAKVTSGETITVCRQVFDLTNDSQSSRETAANSDWDKAMKSYRKRNNVPEPTEASDASKEEKKQQGDGNDWFPCQSGTWNLDLKASESPDNVLKALGVPWAIRKFLCGLKVAHTVEHQRDRIKVTKKSSAGEEKEDFTLDGKFRDLPGGDGVPIPMSASTDPDGAVRITKIIKGKGPKSVDVRKMVSRTRIDIRNELFDNDSGKSLATCTQVFRLEEDIPSGEAARLDAEWKRNRAGGKGEPEPQRGTAKEAQEDDEVVEDQDLCISRYVLVDAIGETLTKQAVSDWYSFASCLSAVLHNSYFTVHEAIRDAMCKEAMYRSERREGDVALVQKKYLRKLMSLVCAAQYTAVDEDGWNSGVNQTTSVGLCPVLHLHDSPLLQQHLEEYSYWINSSSKNDPPSYASKVFIFVRGRSVSQYTETLWWPPLKKVEKERDMYDNVLVIQQLPDGQMYSSKAMPDSPRADEPHNAITVECYSNVPVSDLQLLLPCNGMKMGQLDQLSFASSLIPCLLFIVMGLVGISDASNEDTCEAHPTVQAGVKVWVITAFLFACLAKLGAVLWAFMTIEATLTGTRLDWLESHRTAKGNGAVLRLLKQVEEQELKEALLGYHFVSDAGKDGLTISELNNKVQKYLRERFHLVLNFEGSDAVAKLTALGLVKESGGRYTALRTIPSYLNHTYDRWTDYFSDPLNQLTDSRIPKRSSTGHRA